MRARARPSPTFLPTLGFLALVLTACQTESGPEFARSVHLDRVPHLDLEEDVRIGSVEDPDYGFSSLGWSVEEDAEGNVYLHEARAIEFRVYSPEGELLRRFGRRGEGPGEFSGLSMTFGLHGDTLWAYDMALQRLTLFNLRGERLSTAAVPPVRVLVPGTNQSVRIVPEILGREGYLLGGPGTSALVTPSDTLFLPRIRFGLDGQIVDTAGVFPDGSTSEEPAVISVGRSRYVVPRPAFLEYPWWIRTPDGYVLVDYDLSLATGGFRVTRIGLDGDTLATRILEYDPHPYPESILNARATTAAHRTGRRALPTPGGPEWLESRPEDSAAARVALIRRMDFPDSQPPVQGDLVGADGSIWLQREDLDDGGRRWSVLDPELDPVGEVFLPSNLRILHATRERLWGSQTDDLGVPWLVRFRLVPR